MSSNRSLPYRSALTGIAALASVPLFLLSAPTASSAPAYDSQGYVDSTARCAAPDSMVVFGSTASSRVAICLNAEGSYQYRGVRVRDGARLVVPASQSSDGAFTATKDGIEYMITSSSLVVSAGEEVIRDEPMVDFHRAGTSGTSTETPPTGTTSAPTVTEEPAPTTPLPPPLPAEVGGGEGS